MSQQLTATPAAKPRHPLAVKRFALGYTRDELAQLAGVHVETIKRCEHGGRPRLKNARAIAAALGVTLDEIFPVNAEERPAGSGALLSDNGVTGAGNVSPES